MKNDDTRENFEWLVKLLDMKGIDTPRIIVFFRRVEHMSVVFKHVINTLGSRVLVNSKFGVFYSNFLSLTPIFGKASIEEYSKTPTFLEDSSFTPIFKILARTLGKKAYVNYKEDRPHDDRNRLIDMFHMKTSDIVKSSICQSYADPCGHIRVVLCTLM